MAKISTYVIDATPTLSDKVIGTDVNDLNITKNYLIGDMLDLKPLTSTRMYYGNANNLTAETTALTYIVGGEGSLAADTIKMSGATLNADVTHVNDLESLAIGLGALPSTVTPIASTAIGVGAAQDAVNITRSVAIGTEAMQSLTDGDDNVAIGYRAENGALTGYRNVTIGSEARRDATDGTDNVAVGYRAGWLMGSSAIHNVAIGCATMQGALLGQYNVAIGSFALFKQTGGDFNVAVGNAAFNNLLTGSNNTAIGKGAGAEHAGGGPLTDVNNVTCIGHNSRPIDYGGGIPFYNDQVVLGDSAIQRIYAYAAITVLSDARDKANIQDLPLGLDFLMDVTPRVWDWNCRDGARMGLSDAGFVAQELDAALTAHNGHQYTPRMVSKGGETWGVSSTELIPVLIKAIQELKAEIDLLKNG